MCSRFFNRFHHNQSVIILNDESYHNKFNEYALACAVNKKKIHRYKNVKIKNEYIRFTKSVDRQTDSIAIVFVHIIWPYLRRWIRKHNNKDQHTRKHTPRKKREKKTIRKQHLERGGHFGIHMEPKDIIYIHSYGVMQFVCVGDL